MNLGAGNLRCGLGGEPGNPNHLFNCSPSLTGDGNPNIRCELDGAVPGAMTMVCAITPLSSQGSCQFVTDKEALWDQLRGNYASEWSALGGNGEAMANSLMACMTRETDSAQLSDSCDQMINTITSGDGRQMINVISRLTPRNHDAMLDVSSKSRKSHGKQVGRRLAALRTNNSIASVSGSLQYFDGLQWHDGNTILANNNTIANDSAPSAILSNSISDLGKLGVFVNGSSTTSKQDDTAIESGYSSDSTNLTLGVDYRFNSNTILGLAIGRTKSNTDYASSTGEMDVSSTSFIAYSSFYFDALYFDISLDKASDSYEQSRDVFCSSTDCLMTINQTYSSEFDGSQQSLSFGSGYTFNFGASSLTPSIQYSASTVETDSYAETASDPGSFGGLMGLSVSEQERDISTLQVSLQFSHVFASESGVFIPNLRLTAVEELEDESTFVTGQFVGNSTSSSTDNVFELETDAEDTSYFLVGIGLSMQLKNGNAGFFNVQNIEGYEGLSYTEFTLGWRWEI